MKAPEIASIANKLESLKNIKIAILFGSRAKGTARADSDIDICVMGTTKDAEEKALEYGFVNVDIVPFHRIPLAVQYRVFKDGKILFSKDDTLLQKTKFWTIKRYLDEKHWRDKFTKKVLATNIKKEAS